MSERDIFIAALHKDDPAERSAYLDEACAGDAALRQRLEALLCAHAGATGEAVPDEAADADAPGGRVGPYRLLQQIGEGGMGVVWMAEQREPIRRMVALKVIKPGMDSAQVIARFEAERQALALMDHPNIARVFDAGTTDTGRPYFVMELVKGIPITRYCDEQRLTPRQRLELFVPVCQAIQHAHQKGVIHRDVKPSNVLVASYDGRPVPKVIDFGVAKAMGRQLTERTLFTGFGGLVGTLEYMSPEQAEFNALDIDTRSDVYSLGVLLYELLTGTTPLTKQRLQREAVAEVLRLIREEEPPKPSTRLSESKDSLASISAQRQTEPAKLARLVSGELDWIVMRALEKDRGRRYETANGFAQDVQRYLADEPVQAGPPSARYRLRKFVRRNRGRVIVAGLLLTALIVGSAGTTLGLIEARRQRDQADHARENETAERREAEDRLARLYVSNGARHLDEGDWLGSLPWFAEALRVEQADPERAEVHRRRLGVLLRHCPRLLQAWGPGARSAAVSPDGRHAALWSGGDSSGRLEVRDLFTGEALALTLAEKRFRNAWFSPDGRYLVTCADNEAGAPVLQVHETATGKALPLVVRGANNGQVSPDGRRLVTTGPVKGVSDKQEVRLWDLATGTEQTPPALRALVPTKVVLGSAGRFATMTGTEEAARVEIQVWAAATGAAVGPPIKPGLGADDAASQIIQDGGGRRSHFWPRLAFRPDGDRLATSYAKRARVWDVATGRPVTPALAHEEHVIGVRFSHDGSGLLTAAGRKVFVWHATTGALLHEYPSWTALYGFALPGDPRLEPRYSPDDHCILLDTPYQTFLKDRQGPRAWDLGANRWATPTMTHAHLVTWAEYAPDARRLFTINRTTFGEGDEARLWDLLPARPAALDLRCWGRGDACLSPDGRGVVVDTGQGFQVHDLATGRPVSPVLAGDNAAPGFRQWPGDASCMAFSSNGRFLFVVRPDKGPERRHFQARVYEVATGAALGQPILMDVVGLSGAAVSPDGSRFLLVGPCGRPAAGGVSMGVQLWDTQTGQAVATLSDFEKDRIGPIEAIFSPDGRLVVGLFYYQAPGKHEATGTVRLWDAATGRPVPLSPSLPADRLSEFGYSFGPYPDIRLKRLAFAPDGRRLALTFGANRAYLCSPGDDTPPVALEHHRAVNFVGFSPDGSRVVTASSDLTARVWDAASGSPATPPLEHEHEVVSAAFQANGRLLATVARDNSLRVWDVRTGAPVTPPLPGGNEQVVLSPDGHRLLTFLRRPGGSFGPPRLSWDLTPDARPVDDLVLLAQLLSGHHIDTSGALVPLDAQALHDAWEKLRARYPQDFALSEEALLAWHREEATAAEGRGDWAAIVFHVGRLLRADPGQVALLLRRGKAYAQLGLHEAALADYAEAVRLKPEDWNGWAGRAAAHASLKHDEPAVADWTQVIQRSADNLDAWFHRGEVRARLGRYADADADFIRVIELQEAQFRKSGGAWQYVGRGSPGLEVWYDRALLHLAREDTAGYRRVCETLLGHFRKSTNDEALGRVAWTCALAPDAVKDLAEAERMVQQALQWETEQARRIREGHQSAEPAKPPEPDHLTTAGALAYRRGNFKQAVTLLAETRKQYGTEGSAWDWLFLAMAHRRLGHEDEARQWLRRAAEWIDRAGDEPSWERRLELRTLRREAEALVNGAPAGRP